MDLKEAETLFKRYKGSLYQLAKEDIVSYRELSAMELDKAVYENWRQKLLEEYFRKTKADPSYSCLAFANIVRILKYTISFKEENGKKAVDLLEEIFEQEENDPALLMSLVYGDPDDRNDSFLCWIEKNTTLSERLTKILNFYMKL